MDIVTNRQANVAFNNRGPMPVLDPLTLSIKAALEKRISESRDFFDQLISDYPSCGRFWKIYIEHELKYRNFERAEKLFQRSLIKVLNVDLWKCYLNYVRDIKSKMTNYKEKTAQAYDFALDKIGLDVMSYNIWVDYINFLKSVEASGTFAENQKITAIRKVYQKGVMNPMSNVEQLWKDYCSFENQINPLIAKRMIDDRSREFMVVRKISKEYENVTRNLDRNAPCLQPQGTSDEIKQKSYWKKYIEWEKGNPLKSEDPTMVAKRVIYAYDQCLLYMGTHPDIHYEAASYLQQMSLLMAEKCDAMMSRHYANECINLYEKAINSFMKHNMLIYFAYCDYEESRLNYNKVKEIYEKLLSMTEVDPSLCYIQYMRFLRRIEGIRSARAIFKRAREDSRISYHVFVAFASMEYFCTKDKKIANKIFQLGCRIFGHIPEYLLAFYEFLTHINDDETIRHYFDSILTGTQLPKEASSEIWSTWIDFENYAGNLDDISKVLKKREQVYEDVNQLEERQTLLLIDRYKFMNVYPCSQRELKLLGYSDINNKNYTLLTSGTSLMANLALTNASLTTNGNSNAIQIKDGKPFSDDLNYQQQGQNEVTQHSINPFNSRPIVVTQRYPVPDISKMYPFKPNRSTLNGLQPVPGGGMFLFPSVFADLIKRLPPPSSFNGPFVAVDEFLNHFNKMTLPNDYQTLYNSFISQTDKKKTTASTQNKVETKGLKRYNRDENLRDDETTMKKDR